MATRGRKPSPIELKLVRGNPGKRPLNTTARVLRQDEATAEDRPTMLLEEAASYWDYAFAHAPRTLIKKLVRQWNQWVDFSDFGAKGG